MSAVEVRNHVIRALRDELVGPAAGRPALQWHGPGSELNGEEILATADRPRTRYGAGILFPNGMTYSGLLDSGEDAPLIEDEDPVDAPPVVDVAADGADESDEDDEAPALNSFVPGSMGVSFLADTTDGLTVVARWATYAQQDLPELHDDPGRPWFRTPGQRTLHIAPRTGRVVSLRDEGSGPDEPAILVLDRPWRDGRHRLITVTLLNARKAGGGFISDEECFFQCGLEIRPEGRSAFAPYPGRPDEELDDEELGLKLLYRDRPTWAVGHGCAADWEVVDELAARVMTETMPTVEQAPVLPRTALDGVNLSMLDLSRAPDPEILASCHKLAGAYEAWIRDQRDSLPSLRLGERLEGAARRHLEQCQEALLRIRRGIDFLGRDGNAMTAFRWMNRAMVEQRAHYALSAEKALRRGWVRGAGSGFTPERPYTTPAYADDVRWRPFQLAFVLMNLSGVADPADHERELVDVIWFPTGGGKTEAYLGLAAWTMLRRRMDDPADGGVSILMRYTLRLLTAQQFQRAASLICALELLRRREPRLGSEPYSIGLWLGGSVTPNRNNKAVEALTALNRGEPKNPFVVLSCPWCGVEIGPRIVGTDRLPTVFGYIRREGTVRFICPDEGCEFSGQDGLPLEVIDERIYERPPTMVIGTVDKFAMLPFTPQARSLFGLDYADVSPPDLIIQDELHLISGPLGSMVGHYETLIEALCTRPDRNGVLRSPKIVASTATISRAADQVHALYGREARLFPPQALRAGDSFFAEERSDLKGRVYLGALGSGLSSHIVAQIRLTAALLQAPASLRQDWPDDAVDPYWTLVTYFNSLRELGRASTLIHADIREYLRWVWRRAGITDVPEAATRTRRYVDEDRVAELTSRVPSEDIPAVLERLFTGIPDRGAVDVCFATNMIQVGLDVSRLSLMMIVGQPKGASEYIQASSRVGRDPNKPGLVVTNYNPFKPRDRSHFESFRAYHENIYRFVEPTSVTPFSLPVNERAVHALVVALVRCLEPNLRDKPGNGPDPALRERIREIILKRAERVSPAELDRTTEVLDCFFDDWDARQPNRYGGFLSEDGLPLMIPAGQVWHDREDVIPRPTPTSMRSVDAESEARVTRAYGPETT
jgi:hypothetical protein